ncbi:Cof-type HAD-IIB family hydrolase [Alkalihalobacillus sp. 1P02AB]|uniref:Cof-type HAD-IIB family hydrolase n=1 Tax=Alkalihalobacillus sp. 1P02AB TaxID=3132260 RepID=UPI0039A4194E
MIVERNKKIQLIALDMDGTLLNTNHEISEGNQKAIQAAKELGVHIILSTGRSLLTSKEYKEALKLDSYHITVNGSEIWNPAGDIMERATLTHEDIEHLYGLMNAHSTNYWAVTEHKVWRNEFPEQSADHSWLKFGFHFENEEVRDALLEELNKRGGYEISNSHPLNLEVNKIGINKANAIKKVCEKLGITMDEVMACGDSLNDLAMIKEAGYGIAMGNAQDVVKEAADWVTSSNNEDGVAKAIEQFVLSK